VQVAGLRKETEFLILTAQFGVKRRQTLALCSKMGELMLAYQP
jgi:hypothetical protein